MLGTLLFQGQNIPTLSESSTNSWIWVSSPSTRPDCSRKPKCIFSFSVANYSLKLHKKHSIKDCSACNQTISLGITSSDLSAHELVLPQPDNIKLPISSEAEGSIAPRFPHALQGRENGMDSNMISQHDGITDQPHPQATPRFYLVVMEKNREKAWDHYYVTDRKWWTRLMRNVDSVRNVVMIPGFLQIFSPRL